MTTRAKKKDETASVESGTIEEQEAAADAQDEGEQEQQPPVEQPKTVRAMLLTNVKVGTDYYRAGSKVDLPEDLFWHLQANKAVRRLEA